MSASNICWVCGSLNVSTKRIEIPARSFDATASLKVRVIGACPDCGYERDLSIKSVTDSLALQAHFGGPARVPKSSEARWPRRPSLVGATIRKLCPTLASVLDVGCNNGLNLLGLGPVSRKYGIELSPTLADVARRFAGAIVFQTPIEDFDWKEQQFDVVMSLAVIEHVYDPKYFVQKLLNVLRPGGVLVLMTGDRESYTAKKLGHTWPLYVSSDHVSFFSARSIRRLLNRLDCEILREEWRFMYFHNGRGNAISRFAMKSLEISGLVKWPWHDLYYVYARKQ